MNTQDIIESYMIFGGIPYYLRMLEKRYSLLTMITTYGVKPGKYKSLIQSEVNMDELIG